MYLFLMKIILQSIEKFNNCIILDRISNITIKIQRNISINESSV